MPADSSPKFTVIADASFLWLLAVHIRDNFEGGKVRVVLCVKWGGSSEEAVRVGGEECAKSFQLVVQIIYSVKGSLMVIFFKHN